MTPPDSNKWKYEKLVESAAHMIESDPLLRENPELLRSLLLHILGKAHGIGMEGAEDLFRRGLEEGYRLARPVVPVTDLSDLPELFRHAAWRWEIGRCN